MSHDWEANDKLDALAWDDVRARANLRAARCQTDPVTPQLVLPETLGAVNIYRVTVADIRLGVPSWFQAFLERSSIADGTLQQTVGVGAWGIEDGWTFETATPYPQAVLELTTEWLRNSSQRFAYVTVNGRQAWEIDSTGKLSRITGR
jgi:hypothetical protein